jgi:hypothetical protein
MLHRYPFGKLQEYQFGKASGNGLRAEPLEVIVAITEFYWIFVAIPTIMIVMGKSAKLPTLDLHGFKKDDVFDAVDRFVMKNQNAQKIRIMPGKGEGTVRNELIRYLKLGNYPWSYETMDNGSKNGGSIIVFFE